MRQQKISGTGARGGLESVRRGARCYRRSETEKERERRGKMSTERTTEKGNWVDEYRCLDRWRNVASCRLDGSLALVRS